MKQTEKKQINKMQIDKTQMWNFVYLMQLPLGLGPGEKMIHDVDWELMYRLSRKHNVVTLGFTAANNYKGPDQISNELQIRWKYDSDQSTMQCLYQQAAQEELAENLQKEKIPAIFLKGAVLRDLYPSSDLRSMADIDILVHEEDAGKSAELMKKLGYKIYLQGSRNEDVYCKEPKITVEIHRQLFWKKQTWNEHFYTVWDRSAMISELPCMNVQDFYIHLLGHLIHHMENGGLGIKAFLDLMIFREKYQEQLSTVGMKELLEKFQFTIFEGNIKKLLESWSSVEKQDAFIEEWTEFIIRCGAYGNSENFIIRNVALNDDISHGGRNQKVRYIIRRLFPTYQEMCNMYPAAGKGIYTYPWLWIWRIVKNGVMRYPAMRRELRGIQELDNKKIDKLNKLYAKTGIPQKK